MTETSLIIPCKTFLVGEYSALVGGRALGIGSKPGFKLSTQKKQYHKDSAISLLLKGADFFEIVSNAPGGFGRSTAEFLFAFKNISTEKIQLDTILAHYLSLFTSVHLEKMKPSGADLIIQLLGEMTVIEAERKLSYFDVWPFEKLGFCLFSTGMKIQTHEHLQSLNRINLEQLVPVSDQVVESFKQRKQPQFLSQLKDWTNELQQKGLTHSDVVHMMDSLSAKTPSEVQFKPCGAFGADVILALYPKELSVLVQKLILDKSLRIVACEDDLIRGILPNDPDQKR